MPPSWCWRTTAATSTPPHTTPRRCGGCSREGLSDRTQQPWSELVAIDHIAVDGPVVVVTLDLLDGRSPRLGYESILTRESFTVSP